MATETERKFLVIGEFKHLAVKKIDIKGKSTGGRYYFIDTFDDSNQFLIYENEEFKIGDYPTIL